MAESPAAQPKHRSLATKFSVFTALLIFWVVLVILGYDLRQDRFDLTKGILLMLVVLLTTAAISRITLRLLVRPLALLQDGIRSVREGRLEPIQISQTGDEVELLGKTFNEMISVLASSQSEIRQHQEHLEERIRTRTVELEQAMQKAMAASQTKSEFLANMSHELRTPMSGVLGMIEIVLDSSLTGEQRERLETAQSCAHSLLALLNDILDLSKIEAGRMVLEKIPFQLRRLVEECLKAQLPKARDKGILLEHDISPAVPTQVIGDPLRLRQILNNLLSNAVKFTERGRVTVRLKQKPGQVKDKIDLVLEVADTGPGIAPEKQKLIWEKFTQADGSISRKYGGSGLGLAITRKLVELQQGRISVESKVGVGSVFRVELPVEKGEFRATEAVRAARSGVGSAEVPKQPSVERILVVEDNLVNQKVVTTLLRKKGYQVDVASHGLEAIQALEERAYNLVLMDVQMPVLDGLEATRRIRGRADWRELPIVAMTAHAMNGDRERCLEAGMNGYVSKPVSPAHLLSTVEQFAKAGVSAGGPARASRRDGVPFDQAKAALLTDNDPELAGSMLDLFLQLAPQRLESLRQASDRGDAGALGAEARNIRASAEGLAAFAVATAAKRLQETADRGDFTSLPYDLQILEAEIGRLGRQARVRTPAAVQ